jgi:GT2 family glycosyltransferase
VKLFKIASKLKRLLRSKSSSSTKKVVLNAQDTEHVFQHHIFLTRFKTPSIPRINGEGLSIVILDFSRLKMTRRFLETIPMEFIGEIVIFSQGNSRAHNEELVQLGEQDPRIKLVVEPENLGVAVGRNAAFKCASNDWILSLDNDVYFLDNPFPEIVQMLEVSHANFINLSLGLPNGEPYSLGSSIYSWNDNYLDRCGIRSALDVKKVYLEGQFFLSSALMGGASLLNRKKFFDLGGYDSNFFVGFEDLDFSIRAMLDGQKIISSTSVFLCHDHAAPQSVLELDYERLRYSSESIRQSSAIIENKYGVVVWDAQEEKWLKDKWSKLGLNN